MQKVFFSKKEEDTGEVKPLKSYLERCFVECWLDKTNLQAGSKLNEAFFQAIRAYPIFIPCISEQYLDSNYCRLEFGYAHEEEVMNRCRVIPVVIGDRKKILQKAEQMDWLQMVRTLEFAACVNLNPIAPESGYQQILEAIQENAPIKFSPINYLEIEGVKIQRIDYLTKEKLTFDDMKHWQLDLSRFIERNVGEGLPVKKDHDVAVYARGVGWALSLITLQFANKFKIYMYNGHEKKYLCVHSPGPENETGKVLCE